MWLNIFASIDSGYLVRVASCVRKICPPTSKVMIESDIVIDNYIGTTVLIGTAYVGKRDDAKWKTAY